MGATRGPPPRLPIALLALPLATCVDKAPAPPPSPAETVPVTFDATSEQSETAVVVARAAGTPQGSSIVVAFNDFTIDPSFPGGPEHTFVNDGEGMIARRGLSLMGFSVSLDGGRSYAYRGKVRPPEGWSAIWGDPSIAVDPGDPSIVYMVNLAISDASWDKGSSGADTLADPQTFSDGICVARSADGGLDFPEVACLARPIEALGECDPGPSVCVDHTAVGVDGMGRLYVATEVFHQNGNSGALIHVWRSPSRDDWRALDSMVPEPPTAMHLEPTIVTSPTGDVWIAGATRETPHDIAVNRQRSGEEGWASTGYLLADAGVTEYTGSLHERIETAPGTRFRIGRTFAVAVGSRSAEPDVHLSFNARRADGSFYLAAVHCAPGLAGDHACKREPAWETRAFAGQQFMPSMSIGPGDPARVDVAFLTDDRAPEHASTIQIASRSLAWSASEGASVLREARLTPASWPVCARASPGSGYDGYWGDYIGTAQGLDASGAPFSVTAFSDSRPPAGASQAPSCAGRARFARPLHVAASVW